jgi:hypothetical protein
MIIYGRPDGAAIPLAYFNKSVVRPRSRNKFELQHNQITMSASPITRAARAQLNKDTRVLGHEMVDFVLEFMTYLHPPVSDIIFFRKTILPKTWKNDILGKQNRKTLQSF